MYWRTMMPKQGWLNRQLSSTTSDLQNVPNWMRRDALVKAIRVVQAKDSVATATPASKVGREQIVGLKKD